MHIIVQPEEFHLHSDGKGWYRATMSRRTLAWGAACSLVRSPARVGPHEQWGPATARSQPHHHPGRRYMSAPPMAAIAAPSVVATDRARRLNRTRERGRPSALDDRCNRVTSQEGRGKQFGEGPRGKVLKSRQEAGAVLTVESFVVREWHRGVSRLECMGPPHDCSHAV